MKYNETNFKNIFEEKDLTRKDRLSRKFAKKLGFLNIPHSFETYKSYDNEKKLNYNIFFIFDNPWSSSTAKESKESMFEVELEKLNKKDIFLKNCQEKPLENLDLTELVSSVKKYKSIAKKIQRLKKIKSITIKEIRNISRHIKKSKLDKDQSSEYIRSTLSKSLNKNFPHDFHYSINKQYGRAIKGILIESKKNGIILSHEPIIENSQIDYYEVNNFLDKISLEKLHKNLIKASKESNVVKLLENIFNKKISIELSDSHKEGHVHLELRGSLSIEDIEIISKKLKNIS